MAQNIVKETFGEPPREVLTTPPYVSGFIVHSPGVEGRKSEHRMHLSWRDDLDYWMNQGAKNAGCELWDDSLATHIIKENDGYRIRLKKNGQSQEIKTKYVVGADGAISRVRRSIFPNFSPRYMECIQECYQTTIEDLDQQYIHWWVLPEDRTIFIAHHKVYRGEVVLVLEANGRPDESIKKAKVVERGREFLNKQYGFNLKSKRLWRQGCMYPIMLKHVFSGSLTPANENALLVGDAAGLVVPITAEGIGTGIKSGLIAADSVMKAVRNGTKAEQVYLNDVKSLTSELAKLLPPSGYLEEQSRKGIEYLLDAYKKIYDQLLSWA
jgi:flavin-dependent dehydrogenase